MISKDADGKVKIVKKHEQPTRDGTVKGLYVGLAVGALVAVFPAVLLGAGMLVGSAAGAGIGAIAGHAAGGMSRADLKDLGELLDEGGSAFPDRRHRHAGTHGHRVLSRAKKTMKKQIKADTASLKKEIDQLGASK